MVTDNYYIMIEQKKVMELKIKNLIYRLSRVEDIIVVI